METYAFIHFGLNTYNDLEWGYGNTPASTFNPKQLDCRQWVSTLKQAGMKGVILTAKHHDGFCLWPTATTEYSVKNTSWKNGKGDLVKDLSDECKRQGLKFGIYLSPWDRHHPEYGKKGYREVFLQQINELTSNYGQLFEYWFDGANGGNGWYGGADEYRNIDPKTYYQYHKGCELLRKNNPDIMIFGGTEPTIRWVGNERGIAGETNWSMYDYDAEKQHTQAQYGMEQASQWIPAECDVSIRPGWFYHPREDHQVRSVANLVDLYYKSVGRNATLLLNCPINLDGKIPTQDSLNLINFHKAIVSSFAHNMLRESAIKASSTGAKDRPAGLITDGNNDTFWHSADPDPSPSLIFTLPKATTTNCLMLREYIRLGQRVQSFKIEYLDGKDWTPVMTAEKLTTIGHKRLICFSPITTRSLRITFTGARGSVCISEIGAYKTKEFIEPARVQRSSNDSISIVPSSPDVSLEVAVADSKTPSSSPQIRWKQYCAPLLWAHANRTLFIRQTSLLGHDQLVQQVNPGIPASWMKVTGTDNKSGNKLFDLNGFSSWQPEKGKKSVEIVVKAPIVIKKIVYTPDQNRDASGHIHTYSLLLDGKEVRKGEFSNIKNNPIPQEIILNQPIKAQKIELRVIHTVDNTGHISIGDLSIYTH